MHVAQLTDLHLLDLKPKSMRTALRRRLLSYARPLDAEDRYERVKRQLQLAAGADHLLLTGDLTEDGSPAQFEVLAELLTGGPFPPGRVTLIPGNHDRYSDEQAFARALEGPLRAYRAESIAPVDVGKLTVIPVDTTTHQPYIFSRGYLPEPMWGRVLALTHERLSAGQTVLLAQHHPATRHANAWPPQVLDGNQDFRKSLALLDSTEGVYVIHGHVHDATNRLIRGRERIFSASAVVDSDEPLRTYTLRDGVFAP